LSAPVQPGKASHYFQSLAMNFFVCSGIAQLVALEIWPSVLTWSAVVTVTLLAAVIGARLVLISVAMRLPRDTPWRSTSSHP
jgi:predicted branched-subunit amino acid permease